MKSKWLIGIGLILFSVLLAFLAAIFLLPSENIPSLSNPEITREAPIDDEAPAVNETPMVDEPVVELKPMEGEELPVTEVPDGIDDSEIVEGLSISGIVLDNYGNPIEGAQVDTSSAWFDKRRRPSPYTFVATETDSEGHYTLSGLKPNARYQITASHEDYSTRFETAQKPVSLITEDVEDVNLSLNVLGKITGTVTDENGDPIANASLTIYHMVEEKDMNGAYHININPVGKGLADEKGVYRVSFEMEDMGRIALVVIAGADGYLAAQSGEMVVAIEEGVDGIDFTLSDGLIMSGTVMDSGGNPISNASVSANLDQNNEDYQRILEENPLFQYMVRTSFATKTDEAGHFSFRGLSDINHMIKSSAKGFVEGLESHIYPAGTTDVTISLLSGTSITGKVIDPDGNPVVRCFVSAYQLGDDGEIDDGAGGTPSAFADKEGNFIIDRLEEGTYILCVNDYGTIYRFRSIPIEVIVGEMVEGISLQLPKQ